HIASPPTTIYTLSLHDALPIFKAGLYKNMEFHTGICSVQAQVPVLMRELESGRLDNEALAKMFTHRMGLSEGTEAYAFFDARKEDRKSTRLNSSHVAISYAVFC